MQQQVLVYRKRMPALSLSDCFALALAQIHSWVLLSGDRELSRLATDKDVECHGVLWLLDRMHEAAVVSLRELYDGLTAISQHPRCRLPKTEILRRLSSYSDRLH